MGKILIVEDDPNIAQFLTTIAWQGGHSVTVVTDALGAWTELEKGKDFALVILDQHLGANGGTGLTLLSLLKSQGSHEHPPVIVCTGDARTETISSYLSLGIADYIKKPFRGERVLAAITRVLANKPVAEAPARVIRGE